MLKKKMLRDIKINISQFITIFLMVLIGIMAYSGIEAYMGGMSKNADKFYTEYNLFDLEAISSNFTEKDLEEIKNIPGINDAERKLSLTTTTPDDHTILLNFIESNNISKFYIVSGEKFSNKKGIWLDEYYANKNNLKVGDTLTITYENKKYEEKILGLIHVPDHLYDTKDESELYPDREKLGFAYMSADELDTKVFNYIMIDLNKDANKAKVKEQVEKISNVHAVIDVKDTKSYSTYQGEVDEGKTYVGVFSGLFIFIAVLSVITTMTRVVKKQRIEIGTLKALGFSNNKILFNYISYALITSALGAIAGLLVGYYGIGTLFIKIEASFFEIPFQAPLMNKTSYLVSLLTLLLIVLVTYLTCKSILKENAAETLRNKIPNVKKGSLNITRKKLFKKMNFSSKWNLRDILRNKSRTIMGIVGVTGCAMLIVCALGMLDSLNHFVKLQFEDLYNFNYKLTLSSNLSSKELKKLTDKYGNKTSQTLAIEIKKGSSKETNNAVITNASDKLRFINNKDEFIEITKTNGVYITYKLAELDGYKLGDNITWHIYGSDTYYTSKIVGFNKDPQNQNMTMTPEYLESLGLKYNPDSIYTDKDVPKSIDGVELIQNKDNLKESMNNMLNTMKTMITLIIGIAVLLGSIIIYNLGILSYSEKQYQFATLKVLGFNDNKIKKIFIKQNNWISIISIILGLPLGYYLTNYLFKTAIEEHYDFSAYITLRTYLIAAFGTFIVSYLVSLILSKKIKKIDMVSSLKGNE